MAKIQNEESLRIKLVMNTLEFIDSDGDIVIKIIDFDRTDDIYATFHIRVDTSPKGNKRYTILKIVFEEALSNELSCWIINMVLNALLICDNHTKHYILASTLHSYVLEGEKKEIIEKVKSEIIPLYIGYNMPIGPKN